MAALVLLTALVAQVAVAASPRTPPGFKTQRIETPAGADLYVRTGGKGPPVVLIHGFGDTGDMWAPLAEALAATHTVIIPDLRGMGRSSHPVGGYDKKTQARDIRAVVTALGFDHAAVVGHDIGTMVAYAYAASYPDKVDRLVVMDAPIPGIPPWDDLVRGPTLWQFGFGGPDMERLVQGRARIYLDRFWNEFAGDPSKIDEATRRHYAGLYALPGAMRSSFAQFRAVWRDAADNALWMAHKLTMPVLAIGGEKSFGATMAVVMRNAATNVREAVVPGSGHWLMEESPAYTIKLITDFLSRSD